MLHSCTPYACAHILSTAPTRKHPILSVKKQRTANDDASFDHITVMKFYPMHKEDQMLFEPAD